VSQPLRSVVLGEVGSTNVEALARAAQGERGPLWIVAQRQTAGRGRSGRVWASEPGNLYASLLLEVHCPPAVVPQLSLLAGVATVEAIAEAGGGALRGLRLKWPNDVLLGQAKCAGILAESLTHPASVVAVIGIGINLAWHPHDLSRAATHLAAHGVSTTPEAMLVALDGAVQRWVSVWDGGAGFARVRAAWLERAGPVGEHCTVNTGTEQIAGAFLGIDQSGSMLLRDQQGRQRAVTFGDVALAAAASGETG
jgi:BirA family transcriptional regulator, biotin operon repressor / biotin---[acetyl-CoA-carboxylase] ligase